MNQINIEAIKTLREKTQAGIMDCKAALIKAQGNVEQAMEQLFARGYQIAEKKAERTAVDGIAYAEIAFGRAVLVEVNTESDFVSANERFAKSVHTIASAIARQNPADMAATIACTVEAGERVQTVEAVIAEMSLAFREKIVLRRYAVLEGAMPFAYTHLKGQYGVILSLAADVPLQEDVWKPIAKELALQIAASAPQYVSRASIGPQERAEIEASIAREMAEDAAVQHKPQVIRDRVLLGRIQKYYRTHCLMEQPYIKNPEQSVEAFLQGVSKANGTVISVDGFCRYKRAEGLQATDDGPSNQQYARQLSLL